MKMTSQHDTFAHAVAKPHPVIVIGAGIGGLVSALELAARGVEVLLFEKADAPGGKMREVSVGGMSMDAGPTVFTMRWVFDELFASIGESLDDHVVLRAAEVLARHAWGPEERLDLFVDVRRSADAIGELAGSAASRGFIAFCKRAAGIHGALEQSFMRGSRPTPIDLARRAGLAGLPALMRISPFATLWSELGRYFDDPRLRQLFGRYATYCGSSPFQAAATLMLVAHAEQQGVWTVEGGMHRLARCLARLARKKGAVLRYGTSVEEILVRDGKACGVRLQNGEHVQAQSVVFNGDVAALADGRLGHAVSRSVAPIGREQRSLSALTLNLIATTRGFPLTRHTVFFSKDYAAEFDDIFGRASLPRAPTVYVCAQDRLAEGSTTTTGAERLLMIVNAPATGDRSAFTKEESERCEASTFTLLERCGLQIERNPQRELRTTPKDFERMFPSTGGALYGRASHGWQASFLREGSRSRMQGLYLAGGSVHPGPGVPMAALSGRQAAASVLADLPSRAGFRPPSTSTSRATDTRGGISTR